jgi:hypothetical protein
MRYNKIYNKIYLSTVYIDITNGIIVIAGNQILVFDEQSLEQKFLIKAISGTYNGHQDMITDTDFISDASILMTGKLISHFKKKFLLFNLFLIFNYLIL